VTSRSTGRRGRVAIPRPRRPPDAGDGDRGCHRSGLSRRDFAPACWSHWVWQRHFRWRAGSATISLRGYYAKEKRDNSAEFRAAGMPSEGYATARGMAAFLSDVGNGGRLGDLRLFSPRLISYVSRSHTGEMGDYQMDGIPMHRGLAPMFAARATGSADWAPSAHRSLSVMAGPERHTPGPIRAAACRLLSDQLRAG